MLSKRGDTLERLSNKSARRDLITNVYHLFRNDGEYFNVDPVEFVKAGPSPCLY